MKISREARMKYQLDEFSYSERGNLDFNGKIYSVRLFVQKLNQNKDLINYPEMAIKIGQFNGMALIFEINNYILDNYKEEIQDETLNKELFTHLKDQIGLDGLYDALKKLVIEFPPDVIYKNQKELDAFLEDKQGTVKNKVLFVEEFVNLWLGNINPAFSPYLELFNDDLLEKNTAYTDIVDEIEDFFEEKPKFGPSNKNLIKLLREPYKKHPNSVKKQLEYIKDNWSGFLGKYAHRILLALDLIREEEMMRGLGPGKAQVLEYDVLEERYTPDKEWMPKVIMIAKNAYVWMDQLSKKYKRAITKLHEIPDEELDQLRDWGFNGLWLIGLWERSQASKTIKRWCGNPEAEASAYSLYDYVISYDLGGYDSFKNLKDRAWARGIRLASDMVPNHTGIVSKWTIEHPEWYISLDYPPFPSYSYSGANLSGDPHIGIYLEDKYFSRTDAAVTFKHVDHRNGRTRYIYHGNDGTSFPWNDTAQLNFLIPEVREAVIQTILHVSRLFPIIRFDAAMTLTRKHFQRLWFPEPGTGGAIPSRAEHGMCREDFFQAMPKEFWREVVDRINKENPDTLLLAEAFWLLEGFFVRTLGMHRVYNSAFMNMLSDEDNAKYRAVLKNTLAFDPKILKRFVNFMNNPDEETAIKQFGDGDKYFGVCAMMVTMPGLPMFGHGQIQGFHEKYGMEYRKAYWDEDINWGLLNHHDRTIFPIMKKRYLFAEVENFLLYDFWTGNFVNEDVFAYSNRHNQERGLVIYHNKYAETKGFIKNSVGFAIKEGEDTKIIQKTLADGLDLPVEGYCLFKDYMTGLEYIRRNKEIHEKGLYLELRAYQTLVFMDFQIAQDDEFFHYAQLHDLLGGNGVFNIHDTLNEIIYQALHEPFEQIVNAQMFRDLNGTENVNKFLEEISPQLDLLLDAVKEYSGGKNNIAQIKKEILKKLEIAAKLEEKVKQLTLSQDHYEHFQQISPKDDFQSGILFSWIFLHLLGKIQTEKNYELVSRSWIDEWQLAKYIEANLEELTTSKDPKAWEFTLLIKTLISQHNRMTEIIEKSRSQTQILKILFSDADVQQYLGVNRYQDMLWFNAEAFDTLCNWLSLVTILKGLSYSEKDTKQKKYIQQTLRLSGQWKNVAKLAEYKVNDFLRRIEKEEL